MVSTGEHDRVAPQEPPPSGAPVATATLATRNVDVPAASVSRAWRRFPRWRAPRWMTRLPRPPRLSWQRGITAAVIATLVAELVLGWFSYHPLNTRVALAAICCLPLLFLLDWLARITGPDTRPRWYRRYLAAWCLVPFLCVVSGSFWMHYQERRAGIDELATLAQDLGRTIAELAASEGIPDPWSNDVVGFELISAHIELPFCTWYAPGRITGSEVNAATELLAVRAGPSFLSDEGVKFREISRAVGEDLRHACGDVAVVEQRIEDDSLTDFALSFAVQTVFVLWIPALLVVTIGAANGRRRRRGARSACESMHTRDNLILAEDRALFLPRLCFGALMALGTNYVFSPFGLKETSMMAIVNEHGPPGHATWALWCTSFHQVPILVVGFVGFLLYALITATQRFLLDDFDDRALFSLLLRGLVVILLSFALSGASPDENVSRLFVFVAGIFPLRALEALAKKVNIVMGGELETETGGFQGLPSLDSAKAFALRSAGIQSAYDLAATPIDEIAERVRIDPRLLGRAVDRAILIDAMGFDLAHRLEAFAITSATELVAVKDALPALIEAPSADPTSGPPPGTQLHDAAARVAQRLAIDPRVARVRTWLAGASAFDGLHLDEATERRLREAGLWTPDEVLAMPLLGLATMTQIAVPELSRLLDRALLVESAGLDLVRQLEPLQINTATALLQHANEPAIQAILGPAQAGVVQRIAKHDRFTEIQQLPRSPQPAAIA